MIMDVSAYLRRIDYTGSLNPSAETLRALHRAHLLTVPFENLDIHLGRPIALAEDALFDKVVRRRRGGFCYELNGLFVALLRALGFEVAMLSARVWRGGACFGREFDHMVLLVRLEDQWLADVGFGDSFLEPLRLDERGDQVQDGHMYRVARNGDEWTMLEYDPTGAIAGGYLFTLQPRRLTEYVPMCHYQQTSPESHFTQKRICSRATPDGRITLSDMRLIVTASGQRRERLLTDESDYAAALMDHFGIDLASTPSH